MKEKYFNVDKMYIGCLVTIKDNYLCKKKANPYVIFKYVDGKSKDYHLAKNIFSDDKYYFLCERSKIKNNDDKNYYIANIRPLVYDKSKVTSSDLKSIICHLNILEYLNKNNNDSNIRLLEMCLDDVDLMSDGKIKEYYMDEISLLITKYLNITDSDSRNEIVNNLNVIRNELSREKEISVKKRIKLK